MHIWGYLAAILIGFSLGLIGGGGSILTIPVLVYLFGINPVEATGYSLFIVGLTSLSGAIKNYLSGLVDVKTALLFSGIASITVLIIRRYVLHVIPEQIFSFGQIEVTKSLLIMVVFSILMFSAALKMILAPIPANPPGTVYHVKPISLISTAIGIGCVTGFLGAGGGFLIIPALIFTFHLAVKKAIATSLFIIALNALIGFLGDLSHIQYDWMLLLSVSAVAITGMFTGIALNKKIDSSRLKKGFGYFVIIMAVYVLLKELLVL